MAARGCEVGCTSRVAARLGAVGVARGFESMAWLSVDGEHRMPRPEGSRSPRAEKPAATPASAARGERGGVRGGERSAAAGGSAAMSAAARRCAASASASASSADGSTP